MYLYTSFNFKIWFIYCIEYNEILVMIHSLISIPSKKDITNAHNVEPSVTLSATPGVCGTVYI